MPAKKRKKYHKGSLTQLFLSSQKKKSRNISLFSSRLFISEAVFLIFVTLIMCVAYYYIAVVLEKSPTGQLRTLKRVIIHNLGIAETKKNKGEVIGFLPSWIVAQNPDIHIQDLTQLIYFGLGVTENGELIKYNKDNNPVLEWQYFKGETFLRLKQQAKLQKTKVLVSIKNFDNVSIDKLISNPYATDVFIRQIKQLIEDEQLDGINLDFEYFTDSDFPTAKYLNGFLEKVVKETKKDNPQFLVSLDVNANVVLGDRAYEMEKIGAIVDQVILMAYDYRRVNASLAGPVAPLYGGIFEHSIDESVQAVLEKVPSTKVILGIPFYGYEWETYTANPKSKVVTGSAGSLATYKRVRALLNSHDDVIVHWDDTAKSPWFSYRENGIIKEVYYENKRSIQEKLLYRRDNDLGGVAFWAIGYEGSSQDVWKTIREER